MSKRKFYKTTFKIIVLSEDTSLDRDPGISLEELAHEINEGNHVGDYALDSIEEVSGKAMADLLIELGSEPYFFALTEDGEDRVDDIDKEDT